MNRIALALLAGPLLFAGCGGEEPREAPVRDAKPPRPERGTAPSAADESGSKQRDRKRRHAAAPGIPDEAKRAAVVRVVDGDTVELSGLGNSRLIGVDTPEVYGGAECFGREASDFAKSHLVPGETVHFVRGVEGTDRYGRPLVYLWLSGGVFFNAALVREGYAVPLTIPPNVDYADLFRRLARGARAADRGLWSPSTCGGDPDEPVGGSVGGSGAGAAGGGRASQGCEAGTARAFLATRPISTAPMSMARSPSRGGIRTGSTATETGSAASDDRSRGLRSDQRPGRRLHADDAALRVDGGERAILAFAVKRC